METGWYFGLDNQVVGPVDLQQLLDFLRSSEQWRRVLVWHEGFEEWKPVKDIPEIADQMTAKGGPPPLPAPPVETPPPAPVMETPPAATPPVAAQTPPAPAAPAVAITPAAPAVEPPPPVVAPPPPAAVVTPPPAAEPPTPAPAPVVNVAPVVSIVPEPAPVQPAVAPPVEAPKPIEAVAAPAIAAPVAPVAAAPVVTVAPPVAPVPPAAAEPVATPKRRRGWTVVLMVIALSAAGVLGHYTGRRDILSFFTKADIAAAPAQAKGSPVNDAAIERGFASVIHATAANLPKKIDDWTVMYDVTTSGRRLVYHHTLDTTKYLVPPNFAAVMKQKMLADACSGAMGEALKAGGSVEYRYHTQALFFVGNFDIAGGDCGAQTAVK